MSLPHCTLVCIGYWKFDLQLGHKVTVIGCVQYEMKLMSVHTELLSPDGLWKMSRWSEAGLQRQAFSVWATPTLTLTLTLTHIMRAVTEHYIKTSSVYRT